MEQPIDCRFPGSVDSSYDLMLRNRVLSKSPFDKSGKINKVSKNACARVSHQPSTVSHSSIRTEALESLVAWRALAQSYDCPRLGQALMGAEAVHDYIGSGSSFIVRGYLQVPNPRPGPLISF